ncbi:MAG: hypothetical protein PHS31_01715 [Victivallaceae bacterium]|nr:hypothetical protein [Victivallaceae bacterium]MDD4180359.1 hypothetical protein [Victivallaceae bacterium]
MEFSTVSVVLMIVGALTWLIVILGIARFSKFYISFSKMSKDLSNDLNNNTNVLKKINSANLEMLFEQRRNCRLMEQLLEQFDGAEIIDEVITTVEEPNNEATQD